jgi:hypothetical protein
MRIQELTRNAQIICNTEDERGAIFNLCEQAGLRLYFPDLVKPFKECQNVTIHKQDRRFWEDYTMEENNNDFDTFPASDFLTN